MADRYWVGGTAAWDGTAGTKWSLTSGGAGGEAVPTSSDDVFFNAASGTVTVTVNASSVCNNLNFTGFTGTFAGSQALAISGSLTMVNITRTYTGTITFNATSTGKTIALGGETMASTFIFDGVGGEWTLQDAFNNSTSPITLTNGSLVTNNQTVTCGIFASDNSNTRSLTLGSSSVSCTGWSFGTTNTGMTFSAGTSTITNTMAGTTTCSFGNNLSYNNYTITTTFLGTTILSGTTPTFANFSLISTTGRPVHQMQHTTSFTISGVFTVTGNTANTRRVTVRGFNRTITTNGSFSLTNCDFNQLTAAGSAGTWTGTSIGDMGQITNITATTPTTRYWVGGTGSWTSTTEWSTSSGGASGASMPLAQDTVIFDNNSFSADGQVVTVDTARSNLGSPNFSGMTRHATIAWASTGQFVNGSMTLSPYILSSGTGNVSFTNTGTVTSNTFAWTNTTMTIDVGSGQTLQLADEFRGTSLVMTLNTGIFTTNGHDMTLFGFTGPSGNACTLNLGDTVLTLIGGAGATAWGANAMTSTTVNAGTSTIVVNDMGVSSTTFNGRGKTYNDLRLKGIGLGVLIIDQSNTFNSIIVDDAPKFIQFAAGTTQTVSSLDIGSYADNLVYLQSTVAASAWNITKPSSVGNIELDYIFLQDSNAVPGTGFYYGSNSTYSTGNTGWTPGVGLLIDGDSTDDGTALFTRGVKVIDG